MLSTRTEKDSLGELEVPVDAWYGAQTQRAINNFPISYQPLPKAFITALLSIKYAAAKTNTKLKLIKPDIGNAIEKAITQLITEKNLMQHFPVDIFQTGSGTSTNMNANEVIATVASIILGNKVSPNDHVNNGQSSNDVIPTAIHVSSAIEINNHLIPALQHLALCIETKSDNLKHLIKTGRTHLMDAMPVSMSQSLNAWADQIRQNIENINHQLPSLYQLAQGGTAVGTGINSHPEFSSLFAETLAKDTLLPFKPADNFFTRIGSQDTAVALSGQLKTTAVTLMKIANDLRWMNSGPLSGIGEIELQALQPGSSIMPGKVNPVIPEAVTMVAAQVIGNDSTITIAGQSGNFELNVMLPLIAKNLLENIHLMSNASRLLADKAISSFKVNEENLKKNLSLNPILVTALNPIIGYQKAAEIAKKAYQNKQPIIEVAAEETDLSLDELTALLDPEKLIEGGTH